MTLNQVRLDLNALKNTPDGNFPVVPFPGGEHTVTVNDRVMKMASLANACQASLFINNTGAQPSHIFVEEVSFDEEHQTLVMHCDS